jgi:hypothetical protein
MRIQTAVKVVENYCYDQELFQMYTKSQLFALVLINVLILKYKLDLFSGIHRHLHESLANLTNTVVAESLYTLCSNIRLFTLYWRVV